MVNQLGGFPKAFRILISNEKQIKIFKLISYQTNLWLQIKNSLTHFRPVFHLCRNQVIGFYEENVWKTLVEEWHFKERCRSMTWISYQKQLFSEKVTKPILTSLSIWFVKSLKTTQ